MQFVLGCKVLHVVDHIHVQAYVHLIRRAEKFVYIENQYFLGSCYMWRSDKGTSIRLWMLMKNGVDVHCCPMMYLVLVLVPCRVRMLTYGCGRTL